MSITETDREILNEAILGDSDLSGHRTWIVVYTPENGSPTATAGIFDTWDRATAWTVVNLSESCMGTAVPIDYLSEQPGVVLLMLNPRKSGTEGPNVGSWGTFPDEDSMYQYIRDHATEPQFQDVDNLYVCDFRKVN